MSTSSFLAGLVLGALATVGVVALVPGVLPVRAAAADPAPPADKPVVEEPVPVKQPAVAPPQRNPQRKYEIAANETSAIATLRNLVSAQAQFQASAVADENDNGVGEYGTLAEMAAGVGIRGDRRMNPPVLSSLFQKVVGGRVKRSGYYFRVFLPAADGSGVAENDTGGVKPGQVDAEQSEVVWCVYAWPVLRGTTGERAFFVNQNGDVLQSTDAEYSGKDGPAANAAFKSGTSGITGDIAINGKGVDENSWRPIY